MSIYAVQSAIGIFGIVAIAWAFSENRRALFQGPHLVRAIVVENLRTIRYQCIGLDSDSQSTGSDSMPGNVRMAIDDMITTLEAMKARIDVAYPQ